MSKTYYVVTSVCAFLVPMATIIGLAVLPTSDGATTITFAEFITAAVATVLTGGAAAMPSTQGGRPAAEPQPADE